MNEHSFTTGYEIGNIVYYETGDSERGIIIDISYSLRNRQVKYCVCFGRRSDDVAWCYWNELSDTKKFN